MQLALPRGASGHQAARRCAGGGAKQWGSNTRGPALPFPRVLRRLWLRHGSSVVVAPAHGARPDITEARLCNAAPIAAGPPTVDQDAAHAASRAPHRPWVVTGLNVPQR